MRSNPMRLKSAIVTSVLAVIDGRIVEEWTTFNGWSVYSQALQHLRSGIIATVCLLLLVWLYIGHLVFKWLERSLKGYLKLKA
jgi:hypothetical protein